MNIDEQLADEIESQLKDDILHFAWMSQIARLQKPSRSTTDCTNAVLDSATKLHTDRKIIVGNAHCADGLVRIVPWQEQKDELRTRMKSAINERNGSDDQAFCFWVQLAEMNAG